jgi:RND family efflux transporter MFP subunit
MKKIFLFPAVAIVALVIAGVAYNRSGNAADPGSAAGGGAAAGRGGGRGGPTRPPMPVEFTTAKRGAVSEQILVVGNLIGAATVQVVPRVNGRLQSVTVQLGDAVRQGQVIARVEDNEIKEQVRQAEASYKVSEASIRQREADLKLAETNLERSRSLYQRQLLPQQTFDDTQARHQAAVAQLDLARAQFEQAKARLDELKITLSNTLILAPVDGFVGKRFLDPGGFASTNVPVASVVDIRTVRMVANLVERDMRRVPAGTAANVEVDAFPGEKFKGRVSRVAPIFDPATRTAEIEIEVPNAGYRLKPGMYSRVNLTIDTKEDAITVPRTALIDFDGKTGVFIAQAAAATGGAEAQGARGAGAPALTAKFVPVQVGIRDGDHVEISGGLKDGAQIITTGAGALKDGDRIVAAGGQRSRPAGSAQNGREGGAAPAQGSTR